MSHSTPVSHPACAGLDVSLENVDFFLLHGETSLSGRTLRQANELTVLATQLVGAGVELVVLEATGGLETLVWSVLEQAGLQVAIVSPSRVRHFARSLGQQAKTDRLDAALLAEFGQRMRPPITTLPHPQVRRFQQLLRHRSEVVDQRARWRCTLHRSDEPARASLKRLIALLGGEIALLEQQLAEAAAALPAMATVTDRLQTAPGIGRTTAWTLLAELPELGRISGRESSPAVHWRRPSAGPPCAVYRRLECPTQRLQCCRFLRSSARRWQT